MKNYEHEIHELTPAMSASNTRLWLVIIQQLFSDWLAMVLGIAVGM